MAKTEIKFPLFSRSVWAIGGVLFLALATAFVGVRTYRNFAVPARDFDWQKRGMSDFYTLYYYSSAFADGVSPYSADLMNNPKYVVPRNAAPFSPFAFLIDTPLTWMPLQSACALFFLISWSLIGVLAYCCIWMSRIRFDWTLWFWIFGFLVFSRPGHVTLFTGYFTVQLVLGTLVALHYSKSNPWLAGIGFLFASVKPTYVIPLTILMLARRDYKAVVVGVVLTTVFAVGCFGWLVAHSDFQAVIESVRSGQEAFEDDRAEAPLNTWTRVDVAGMVAKMSKRAPGNLEYLSVMCVLLVIPCFAVWHAAEREGMPAQHDGQLHDEMAASSDQGAAGLSALIVVLAMLVTIYHHSYDCLIVSVGMVGLLLNSNQLVSSLHGKLSMIVATLLSVPMLNYASTKSVRDRLGFDQLDATWQLVTMLNGVCLVTALGICIYVALAGKRREITNSQTQ